jgi:hypothetical protein
MHALNSERLSHRPPELYIKVEGGMFHTWPSNCLVCPDELMGMYGPNALCFMYQGSRELYFVRAWFWVIQMDAQHVTLQVWDCCTGWHTTPTRLLRRVYDCVLAASDREKEFEDYGSPSRAFTAKSY